ncbi:hypothetical protein GGI21_004382, partial [Coemansia aciculifera]
MTSAETSGGGKKRGKHDGSSKSGKRYFTCTSPDPHCASFIRNVDRIDWGQTLLQAAQSKYTVTGDEAIPGPPPAIDGSRRGKIEAVGFDKVACEQSDLTSLHVLGLDSQRVFGALDNQDDGLVTGRLLGQVTTLLLSRNYLTEWSRVLEILRVLPNVQTLDISGNPLNPVIDSATDQWREGGFHVDTLRIDSSPQLSWTSVSAIACQLHVHALSFGWSRLTDDFVSPAIDTLEDLSLDCNDISNLLPLLSTQPQLRSLSVRSNPRITEFPPCLLPSLSSLNLGSTGLLSWTSIDNMRESLPVLRTLYLANTPLDPGTGDSAVARALVIGRLPDLGKLDGTVITNEERTEMERYYLVMMSNSETGAVEGFPRRDELIAKHGPPPTRKPLVESGGKIGARLVTVSIE